MSKKCVKISQNELRMNQIESKNELNWVKNESNWVKSTFWTKIGLLR